MLALLSFFRSFVRYLRTRRFSPLRWSGLFESEYLSPQFSSRQGFFSILPPAATEPSGAIGLIYAGALVLGISVITLAIGLFRVSPLS